MSDPPINSTHHSNSHPVTQPNSVGNRILSDTGEWGPRRKKSASSDSLPEAPASLKSSTSPASSLTSSPRQSPRATHHSVRANGHKGPKSPIRGSPTSHAKRKTAPVYIHPQSRSPKTQIHVLSTSSDKARHATDFDQSSGYSTASGVICL